MAAFTSKATGNWSSGGQTTWTQVGVPASGDTVTIQTGHTVTVDVNTTIGAGPANNTAQVTIQSGATVVINSGVTWTVRGALKNDGTVTQNGNVAANGTVNQVYTWQNGTTNGSGAQWVARGTSGTHITLVVAASSCIVTFDDSLGNNDTGQFDAQYLDITRLGNATHHAFAPSLTNSGDIFSLQDGSCDTCGGIGSPQNVSDGAIWRIKNFTFLNSVGDAVTYGGSGTYTTGTRLIDGSVFDTMPVHLYKPDGITVTGTYFGVLWDVSSSLSWTSFDGNMSEDGGTSPLVQPGDISNTYFLKTSASANPHYVTGDNNRSVAVTGSIFEAPNDTSGNGDCVLAFAPGAPTTYTYTVKHNIMLPNGVGGDSGTPHSQLGDAFIEIVSEHNTYHAEQGANTGETYGGRADSLRSFKSNLAWHQTSNTGMKIFYDRGTATPGFTDYVHSANADYNGGFNLQAGSNGKGYDNLAFSSGAPGAHDVVNVDPQFVDSARGIVKWDTSLGGPGTMANALAELKKRNLSTWNSAYNIAALLTYVKAGFVPQAAAYQAAHDNVSPSFGWIGAMQGTSGATTPTPLVGAGVLTGVAGSPVQGTVLTPVTP
jgi:hypothetical protein